MEIDHLIEILKRAKNCDKALSNLKYLKMNWPYYGIQGIDSPLMQKFYR